MNRKKPELAQNKSAGLGPRVLTAAALLGLLFGAIRVNAANKVQCEVLTIQASNAGRGIDQQLKAHEAIFRQPPFSAFNSFDLVHRKAYLMPLELPVKLHLPASLGGSLRLNKDENGKLDLTLTLIREGKSPVDIQGKASLGAPFFAAGFRNPEGVWIFGVVCNR